MPKLIAKERFYYNGRNVEADEEFDALEQDVVLLTDAVSPRARKSATADTSVAPMTTEEAPKKRRYMRRDMKAGDA